MGKKYKIGMPHDTIVRERGVVINLGFPDYIRSKDLTGEFQISIDLILNKQDKSLKQENTIRKKLLELFEIKKIESYEKFKII